MQKCGAAFNVAQKLESESLAFAGTLDEAGNIGDRIPRLTGLHNAEIRVQSGEGVVGDLGARGRESGDQA